MTPGRLPRWLLPPAALAVLLLVLPVVALLVRAPWTRLPQLLTSEASLAALRLSLLTATASTLACLLLGVPLALLLSRWRGRIGSTLRTLVLLPLVLPPVVGGLALLYTFGRRGLLGPWLELAGIQIAFSTVAVVLAQTFVSLPFLVLSLEGTLRTRNLRHEDVAACLGVPPGRVLIGFTLPMVLPALLSATLLAFARALGEFGATLTFAGSLQGTTRTLPLEIYLQRESDADAAVALSVLLLAVAVAVMALAHRRVALR